MRSNLPPYRHWETKLPACLSSHRLSGHAGSCTFPRRLEPTAKGICKTQEGILYRLCYPSTPITLLPGCTDSWMDSPHTPAATDLFWLNSFSCSGFKDGCKKENGVNTECVSSKYFSRLDRRGHTENKKWWLTGCWVRLLFMLWLSAVTEAERAVPLMLCSVMDTYWKAQTALSNTVEEKAGQGLAATRLTLGYVHTEILRGLA